MGVSMPSRAYTSFLHRFESAPLLFPLMVSMPSRAYTSFLPDIAAFICYTVTKSVNALSGLYLISTDMDAHFDPVVIDCVNALSGLYLIST